MARQYSTPRYAKSTRRGRKPLPKEQRRKTISVRVAQETYQHLIQHGLKAGREIDRLVKQELQTQAPPALPVAETIDEAAARNTVLETARGLIALITERGTDHLTLEQAQLLDDNFTLIINNYLATFKHKEGRKEERTARLI